VVVNDYPAFNRVVSGNRRGSELFVLAMFQQGLKHTACKAAVKETKYCRNHM
jgi:hypothetical protein